MYRSRGCLCMGTVCVSLLSVAGGVWRELGQGSLFSLPECVGKVVPKMVLYIHCMMYTFRTNNTVRFHRMCAAGNLVGSITT